MRSKRIIIVTLVIVVVAAIVGMNGCTYERTMEDGRTVSCLGLGEEEDPRYVYGVSGWNLAMGVIFFEIIVPPIVVLADAWKCPESVRHGVEVVER